MDESYEDYDHDLPDDDDDYEADDDTTDDLVECPHCGAAIYEDSVACPRCGEYITNSSHPFAGRPWWWLALGALGILALLASLIAF
ncbi:MAG: zinc-ribbon domain-containing protein [Pirellulales bacterium]|nr:zinc-ribbon domain-containing protein [Pirellulales bacterium]